MANEIGLHVEKTLLGTPYAIIRNSINEVWDSSGSQFVTYIPGNLGDYDIPMAEQGAAASNFWIANFPVHVNMIPGVYTISIYDDAGAIAEGNPFLGGLNNFEWDGGNEVDPNLIHMDLAFNIDDGNTQDEYSVIFKINGFDIGTAAFTGSDPDITVRERDDSVLVPTVAMTQVGATAQWVHDETVNRVVLGEAYFVDIDVELYGIARTFKETIRRDD